MKHTTRKAPSFPQIIPIFPTHTIEPVCFYRELFIPDVQQHSIVARLSNLIFEQDVIAIRGQYIVSNNLDKTFSSDEHGFKGCEVSDENTIELKANTPFTLSM